MATDNSLGTVKRRRPWSRTRVAAPMGTVQPSDMASGDIVFCYGRGVVALSIRAAERLHRDLTRTAWGKSYRFDHVAIVDQPLGDGDWTLIQALRAGVIRDSSLTPSRLSHLDEFSVIRCPGDPVRTVEFAHSQVGKKYGFVTVFSFVATLFTPRFINVMVPRTWICSALTGEALRFGGWLHDWPDIYQVTPAQLWIALALPTSNGAS